jgi:hypothetical protein
VPIPASQYARDNGVSVARVHQLIARGQLSAERIGHRWSVNEARVRFVPVARPLTESKAWILIQSLSGDPIPTADRTVRFRIKEMMRRLETDTNASTLLRSWVAERAVDHHFAISYRAMRVIRVDNRLKRKFHYFAGDRRDGGQDITGYANRADFAAMARDLTPIADSRVNLTIRVTESDWPKQTRSRAVLDVIDQLERDIPGGGSRLPELLANAADRHQTESRHPR